MGRFKRMMCGVLACLTLAGAVAPATAFAAHAPKPHCEGGSNGDTC